MTAAGGQSKKRAKPPTPSVSDDDSEEETPTKRQRREIWKREAFEAAKLQPAFMLESYGGGQSQVLFTMGTDHKAQSKQARKDKMLENRKKRLKNKKLTKNKQLEIDPLAKNIIEKLFEGAPDQVRKPRSFEDDRERQVLRWTATSLLTMFPKGVEVQCYYENGSVYVTSNDNTTNNKLYSLFKENKGNVIKAVTASYDEIAAKDARTQRHVKKLTDRAEDSVYEEQDEILHCLKSGKVVVVQGSEDGLHAERRIQAHLKTKLDPNFLAGVKRPCAVCAVALELTGRCFPGPAWTSAAATQGMEPDGLIDYLAKHVESCDGSIGDIVSYVTQMKDGSFTTGYDTESDSEDEADGEMDEDE